MLLRESASRTRRGFKRCFASAGTVPLKRVIFLSHGEKVDIFLTMNTISSPVEIDRLNVTLTRFDWFMKGCLAHSARNDFDGREVDISFIVVGTKQAF